MINVSLPARLDTPAAKPLAVALQRQIEAGSPLDLPAGDVEVAGLACLQVLASARNGAIARQSGFSLVSPSEALRDACALAGLGLLLEPIEQGSPA